MSDNEVDEVDGMGGEGGGIITPYSFQPAPVGGTAVSGQQLQPQMWEISNAAVAADGVGAGLAAGHLNRKRARQRIYVLHTSSPSSNPNEQDPLVLSSGGGNTNETEMIEEVISNPQPPVF